MTKTKIKTEQTHQDDATKRPRLKRHPISHGTETLLEPDKITAAAAHLGDTPSVGRVNVLTNEEARVVCYSGHGKPTNPSDVTAQTPLDQLYLNWTEKELPERERTKHVHRLHPYLGKYIPQLVEIFLRKFFSPGQTVLDPFAGSGTTLVQAQELGINAVGYDVSAFNCLLMNAKTMKYDPGLAAKEIKDILSRVTNAAARNYRNGDLFQAQTPDPTIAENIFLDDWFAPLARRELEIFKALINQYQYQDILKVILSRAARSSRLTTHFDLDFPKKPQLEPYHCYKHRRVCQPTQTALKFITRYCLDSIKRISEYSKVRTEAAIEIHHKDSAKARIQKIDGVITSPPYVGLIDYHEQHRYAYELFGLEDRRFEEIGPARAGTSRAAKKAYQEQIASVFNNALGSMPRGGYLIVIAGDRQDLYGEIASMLDVAVEGIVTRHVNRRTGRRSTEFYESVFIWRKQ